MSSRILKIGRTNYYSVRKGQQQYCIAEGRRVQDLDHCWQVLRDPDSGRNFFVNRAGVRRWHLPDIFQTERERQEEEKTLKFRRQQKAEELKRQKAKEKAGGAAEGDDKKEGDGDGGPPAAEGGEEEAAVSDALKGVVNNKELFAARDAAARQLPLLRGWETPLDRKPVTRLAKAVLSPFFHQGAINEEALAALVMTGTREFCAKHATLGPQEREEFIRDLKSLVQARVDEDTRRNEFQKMNEELLDRLKRLDQERKEQAAKLAESAKLEEEMKQELFLLRAHKQGILLQSFKRLTRAGLVQAYWERWTRYKSIVEAQNHVNARERRTKEMGDKIKDLETNLQEKEVEVEALREEDQKRKAIDVINRILGQLGRDVLQRFFLKWIKFAVERKNEKDMFKLREELMKCPRCEQRRVDMDRVSMEVLEAWQATHTLQRQLALKEEESDRQYFNAMYWRACADFAVTVGQDGRRIANNQYSMYNTKESLFKFQEAKIKELTREIDGLRFEVSVGGGSAALMRARNRGSRGGNGGGGGADGGDDDGGEAEDFGDDFGDNSPTAQSGGGGSFFGGGGGGGGGSNHHHRIAVRPADDRQLTSFFLRDANAAESKLERKFANRADAGVPPPSDGIAFGGPRGYVEAPTQSSIAPSVFASVSGSTTSGDKENQQQRHNNNNNLLTTKGSKYYDPVIINVATANKIAEPNSAFDQRTREIQQKKQMLEKYGTIPPKEVRAQMLEEGFDGSQSRKKRAGRRITFHEDGDDDDDVGPPSSSDSSASSSDSDSDDSSSTDHDDSNRKNKKKKSRASSGDRQSPSRSNNNKTSSSPSSAKQQQQQDPLSKYLAEKEARKQQASVLHFIKPPISAEEAAAARAKAMAEAFETAEEKEAKRCPKCGFRYDSAAFCPKDGTRHTYRSLELKLPVEVPQHNNTQNNISAAVPDAVAKLLSNQQQMQPQPLPTHKDDPMRVLVMPEYQSNTTKQLASLDSHPPQYLKLPNGIVPASDSGKIPELGASPPPPHPLVQRHANMLRTSLNLDPRQFKQPRLYTVGGEDGDSFVPGEVQHPKELADARNALEEEALYRDTIDNVRFTRIMTESTRRITDRANVHSVAAEEKLRSYAERSTISGYNPSADADNALSLESRLFTGKNQTNNLDKDNLHVPDYFTATSGFATRTGAFQSTNTVPSLVQEKLTTHASAYYKDLVPPANKTFNNSNNNNGAQQSSSSAQHQQQHLIGMSDPERVQRNIHHYNDPSRQHIGLEGAQAGVGGRDALSVPIQRGAGGFRQQPTDLLLNPRHRNPPNQSSNMSSAAAAGGGGGGGGLPQHQRTSWSNVFQYNDVLFDRGLGLNAGDATIEVFGTQRERQAATATNAQQLAQQMASAPSFARQTATNYRNAGSGGGGGGYL